MPRHAPRRPPAALLAGVVLLHALALQAWRRPAVLQGPPAPLQAARVIPMPLLPTDTGLVAAPPQSAAQRRLHDGLPAPPPALASAPDVQDAPSTPAARPPIEMPPAAAQAMAGAQAAEPAAAPAAAITPWPDTARLPPPARWTYVATQQRRGLLSTGTGTLDWSHDGRQYALQLAWAVPGMPPRSQTSVGGIDAHGLVPRRYGVRGRSEFATHLDAANARVVFSSNRPQQPWAQGLQDRASVLVQLAGWLAADPGRFTPGTVLRMPTVGSHEAADWDVVVEGPQVLNLPGGRLDTVRVTRAPTGPWDLRLEAWFAPAMDYALVRLRLTPPNGDWLDLQWSGTDSR